MKKPIILLICTALSVVSLSSGVSAIQEQAASSKSMDRVYAADKKTVTEEAETEEKSEEESEEKTERKSKEKSEEKSEEKTEEKSENKTEEKTEEEPKAETQVQEQNDDVVITKHTGKIQGKSIDYTATTGTMRVEVNGEAADMFFVAYTVEPEGDIGERPITFAFNGGPGAASTYINFGCLGPRRVELDEKGSPVSMPAKYIDNENSVLDMTDLVFIDAVGTGYSTPVDPEKLDAFIGYENDLASVGEFIRLYVNKYDRWGSEKYIAGESYGTTRAVGLCDYLSNVYALDVNGLLLLSSINDFITVSDNEGNEMPYLLIFPTLAADAWYHKVLAKGYQDMELEDYLDEVREFVSTDLLYGLFMGDRLSKSEKKNLAEKIAGYTGLSKDYILKLNLRISLEDFRNELLRDKNLSLGRYDGRVTGPLITDPMQDSDPSSTDLGIAFGNTFADYVNRELLYKTDTPYVPMSYDVNGGWSFPNYDGYFSQENVIYGSMARNKFLKIWVICGYYDGATPFYAAEYTFNHVFLNEDSKDDVQFTYYPSGHMIYVEKESFDQFRKDAEKWFGKSDK